MTRVRRLLALLVSGGLVLLLGGLGLAAGWQASERAMSTHEADRLALQTTLAGLVEQYARTSAGELLADASDGPWSADGAVPRLQGLATQSLHVDAGALLLDATGRPLAAWTAPGVVVPAAGDPGWAPLRAAVARRALPVSGVLSEGDRPMTAVGVPVPLADGTRGLVIGLSDARESALQGYVEGLVVGRTRQGYVVDGAGLVLAGPESALVGQPLTRVPRRLLVGTVPGIAVYDGADAEEVVSWAPAGTTGWTALTVQDEQEFAGALRSAGRRAQALVAALLVMAGTGLVVLHRKREAALEQVALRDDLTGLYNRRGWFLLADAELRRAARLGQERVLLFVDLDGLKQVNDVLGHREGDRAIASAARVLSGAARDVDLVGRLGGDEFVLLLGEDGHAEAARARVLAALAAHNVASTAAFELRLSLGAEVWFPHARTSLDELVRRADASMYADKTGRPDRGAGVVRVPAPRSEGVPVR